MRPSASSLLFGRGLGFPTATAILVAACLVTTAPMFVSKDYYLVLGAGHETADVFFVAYWKSFVTPFIHGGGWPGTLPHLLINTTLFLFLGTLTERLLGSARFSLVTLTSLLVQTPFERILIEGRGHGASGMTWSYPLFVGYILILLWRRGGAHRLKEPLYLWLWLLVALECLGTIKIWHAINTAVSVPFFYAWRHTLRANLERFERGEPLDEGSPTANRIGVAAPALLFAYTGGATLLAVLGVI